MTDSEVMLRTAAFLALAVLAGLILAARRRDHVPALGALAALAAASFVVTSARGADAWLGGFALPLTALCVAKAAFFRLFARGLFAESLRLRGRDAALVAFTMAYGLWQQVAFAAQARAGSASVAERLAASGFELWVMALVVLALRDAWRGLAIDLVEGRRRMRILFVAGGACYLAAAVLVQSYNLALGTATPPLLVLANLALIAILAFAAAWNLVQPRTASWLDPEPADAQPEALSAAECRVLRSLQEEIVERHVYREEGLTIGALARRLGTREHVLRRVINRGMGYRNFNDFLHAYRIREACARLRRAEDARLPVLSIALDVGYGSIGPFNRAFKSRMGMTPTRFRRSAGAASSGA